MKEQLLPKDTQQGKDQSTSHEHGDDEAHGGHGHEHGHSHAHSGSISRGFESDEVHCADQDSMVDAPEVALVLNPKRRRDLENDLGSTWKLKMASEKSSRKFLTMLVLSTGYLLAEMVFGILSGSLALLADAFHMLTDVVAILCGYWVAKVSTRSRTNDMSFGWKRAEIVGALANGCFLLAVCFTISLEAIEKLFGLGRENSEDLENNADQIIVVGCVGLLINLLGMCVFGGHGHSHGGGGGHSHVHSHGHSHGNKSNSVHGHSHGSGEVHMQAHGASDSDESVAHDHHSSDGNSGDGHAHEGHSNMNEWSMYLHVMGDALGSAIVILNASLIKYAKSWGDYRFMADPITSLLMVAIILVQTIPLVKDTALILMETAPSLISEEIQDVDSLHESLSRVEGVLEVHELHIWRLNQSTALCTVHVVMQTTSTQEVTATVDRIKQLLHSNNIHSSTIQTEIISMCESAAACSHLPSSSGCARVEHLSKNLSNCADLVCDDNQCLTNSCCSITDQNAAGK